MNTRDADLGKTEPLENIHQRQWIGEHAESKVMPAQLERREANEDTRNGADCARHEEHQPWRQSPVNLRKHRCKGANAEKAGMAERYESGITAEDVPAQTENGPDQHQGQDQLIVGVRHKGREYHVGKRQHEEDLD
ncbi:hypothetical protein D3C80_1599900 [compost metagenome]